MPAYLVNVFPCVIAQTSGLQGSFNVVEGFLNFGGEVTRYCAVVFEADLSTNNDCSRVGWDDHCV